MKQETETPELPNGWEWQGGNLGESYYTTEFGTKYRMGGALAGKHGLGGYSGQVYWDEGGEHHVVIEPITSIDDDDPVYGYPEISQSFKTEEEAFDAVPEMINAL